MSETDEDFAFQTLQTGGCHRLNELAGAVVGHPSDASREGTRQHL